MGERRSLPRWRAPRRSIQVAMGLVVASFVLGTVYTQLRLNSTAEALDIAFNSAPSVSLLADSRDEVRNITLGAEQGRVDSAARKRLGELLARYAATPFYQDELEAYSPVAPLLARLDGLLAELGGANRATAGVQIRSVASELEAALRRVSVVNQREMEVSGEAVRAKSHRANVLAFVLDGAAILLAVLASWLVILVVEQLLAALDRRSHELELMALQVCHEIANPVLPIQAALTIGGKESPNESTTAAFDRAQRSLKRITGSLDNLLAFASAGRPPSATPPATQLQPVLAAVAGPLGVQPAVDPALNVACEEPVLRQLLDQLVALSKATEPRSLSLEVRAAGGRVRISVVCGYERIAPKADPFEAELRGPELGQPGIDLRPAVLRRLVEARGGRVGVRPRRHARTLFIELPQL